MLKKRPCRVCRRWFLPDPHVGDRQKVCGQASCQKERHRRESVEYRRRERTKRCEDRVVTRIRTDGVTETETPAEGSLLARLDWVAVRELVGPKLGVIIQETGRVLVAGVRELVRSEVCVRKGKSRQVVGRDVREQLERGEGVPYGGGEGEALNARRPALAGPEVRTPEGPQPP